MYRITDDTLHRAYKPYDIVTNKHGDVGFIQEVSVNACQSDPAHQISYAVHWLTGNEYKHAWFSHGELTQHCNLFIEIARVSCHPSGDGGHGIKLLFRHF